MRGLGNGARRAEGAAVRAVAALLAVTAAACSSSPGAAPGAPGAPGASPPAVAIPLDTTLPTPSGTVAVVAMGLLHDPLNTFWQLFSRAGGADGWTLVTPPGVADNGGLVAGSSGSDRAPPGGSLLVGFEPSQDLVFSPLAQSADQGRTWSAGLVPSGLMAVPDALALAPDGEALALLRPHGGEVVRSTGATSAWTTLVRAAGLASAPGASACGVGRLTAIGFDTAGAPLVATSCSVPGVSGIFESTGGRWRLVGPRLAVDAPATVVRLVDDGGTAVGLVVTDQAGRLGVVGVSGTTGGTWARSAPLRLGPGARIAATGLEPGGGFVVLASSAAGSLTLATEAGPAGGWQVLATPPAGTAAVAVGADGEVDALVVAATVMTDWRLDTATGRWGKIAAVRVPIEFGSSS